MASTTSLALHYGLRLDASPEFVQGYVDGMRLDQRGQGVACGRGWIPRSKKCSRDKASATPKEAKDRTVEKAKERAKLKGEVKAAKGQKARVKKSNKGKGGGQPIAPSKMFEMAETPTKRPRGESARLAATKPIESELRKVIDLFASGSLSFGRENRIVGGAREGLVLLNSSKRMSNDQYAATYNQVKRDIRNLYAALNEKPFLQKRDSIAFGLGYLGGGNLT